MSPGRCWGGPTSREHCWGRSTGQLKSRGLERGCCPVWRYCLASRSFEALGWNSGQASGWSSGAESGQSWLEESGSHSGLGSEAHLGAGSGWDWEPG